MAEMLGMGRIVGWETTPEVYAERVVGINTYEQNVLITLAVNRVEPGKNTGAESVMACVTRLVIPFIAANELMAALNNMASVIALAEGADVSGKVN